MDNRIALPQGKQPRWYERLQWGACLLVLLAIAPACDGEIDSLPSVRDIGGGLLLTAENQVVDVYSMAGAISAEEAAFLAATDVETGWMGLARPGATPFPGQCAAWCEFNACGFCPTN